VFYAVGIIINITLNEKAKMKLLEQGVIERLIEVLKDSNIEDLDLSKVASKALLNLTSASEFWQNDSIKKLDGVLQNIGEELDSIMVRI